MMCTQRVPCMSDCNAAFFDGDSKAQQCCALDYSKPWTYPPHRYIIWHAVQRLHTALHHAITGLSGFMSRTSGMPERL